MSMEEKRYDRVGEKLFHMVLDNGLSIYVAPKPDFQKSYAFFATNYGGMDMRFRLDGNGWILRLGWRIFWSIRPLIPRREMPFRIWLPTVRPPTPLPPRP